MTDFATLVLGADTRGLRQGADDGKRAVKELGEAGEVTKSKVASAASAMSLGFKAMAVSAGGILTAAVALRTLTGAIGRIDAMDEAAQSIDGTVNALRALQLATGEAGISQGDLMTTMQAMNRELAKAQEEGGPAADALKKIGLNAKDLAAMDADARLAAIADAMHDMGLSAGQATAILQDLGVRSKEMSVALLGGGDAIRKARSDIASLGLELNKSGVDAVARANDALGRMGLASEALGNQIAVALAPALESMAAAFVSSLQEGGALRLLIDGIASSVTLAAGAVPYLISGVAALGAAYATSLIPAVTFAIGQMIALEMALGAVGVASALASIGIKALSAAIAFTPVGLILAAGAGLYALSGSSVQAANAADIQAKAERGLQEALSKVNSTGSTAITQRKELAQASLDQAKAKVIAAQAELEAATQRAAALAGTRAQAATGQVAEQAAQNLIAAQAALAGIVAEANRLGIALSGLPPVVQSLEQAAAATAASFAAQYEIMGRTRSESDAALVSAQALLATQNQKNEIARLTLQYGADSAQVANAHRDAELGVLSAQLEQLDVSASVKDQIIQSANAGFALEQAVSSAGGAAATLASRAGLVAGVLWPAVEAARQLASALGGAVSQLGGIASGMARMTAIGRATSAAGGVLGGLFNAGAINAATTAFSGASAKIQSLYATSVKAAGAGKTLAQALAGTGGAGGGGVAGGAKAAVKELTEAEKATKKYQETMQGFVEGGIGKAVDWMVSGFKGGLKGLLNVFKSTISQMVAYAIKNKIMISLGMGGSVAGSVASAATGGGAAGGSGIFSGIIGKIGGVFSSFISGASGLVTSLFGAGGGLGAAGTYLSSVLGGATAGLGGLAAAAGALALPVLAIVGIFSFFKKKTKELDSGLKVTVNGLDVMVETFRKIQTSKYWGLSKKTSVKTVDASKELADPITNAFLAVRANVVSMAKAIGVGSDALAGFTAKISLSTKGMSQEQAQEAVLKELAKLGDQLSSKIAPPIKLFAKAGETAMETLTRLSSSLTSANDAFKALGYGLFNVTIAGAGAAAKFVDLFGSLDAFKTASDFYFQNFYSLSERTRYLASQFGASLTAIGQVKVPHTVAEFRAMVDALKLAGKDKAVAELMKLAPMFTQLLELRSQVVAVGDGAGETAEALAKLAEKQKAIADERYGLETRLLQLQGKTGELRLRELKLLDPSNQKLQKLIWGLEDMATAAEKAKGIADERKGLEEQLLTLQGDTAELRRRELAALDPTNQAMQELIWGLEDAKAAIDDLDPESFATLFDFQRAQNKLASGGSSSYKATGGLMMGSPPVFNSTRSSSAVNSEMNELKTEIQKLQSVMREVVGATVSTAVSVAKDLSMKRKWDADGLPPTRV